MFQMNEVGGKIAAKRKALNMTQMELADLMGVSFQAVSNWERGNSMPDIAKLPDLAQTLDISIDELLSEEAPAKLIRHILDGNEREYIKEGNADVQTVTDVAPLLKPKQAEALLDEALNIGEKPAKLSDLVAIAPFVGEDFLHAWVMKLVEVGNISDLMPLAPFLSTALLDQIVDKVTQEEINLRTLIPLAPFLSEKSLDMIVKRAASHPDSKSLVALAPYLSDATLGMLAKSAINNGAMEVGSLVSLAPFLSEEALDELVQTAMQEGGNGEIIVPLAPFLSQTTLNKHASKLLESLGLKSFKKIAPFL